jgi:hypothetical protein
LRNIRRGWRSGALSRLAGASMQKSFLLKINPPE